MWFHNWCESIQAYVSAKPGPLTLITPYSLSTLSVCRCSSTRENVASCPRISSNCELVTGWVLNQLGTQQLAGRQYDHWCWLCSRRWRQNFPFQHQHRTWITLCCVFDWLQGVLNQYKLVTSKHRYSHRRRGLETPRKKLRYFLFS